MIIRGKERKFLYTIKASEEIGSFCGGNIAKLAELLDSDDTAKRLNAIVNVIQILNKGYEEARAFEEPGYVPDVVTVEELKFLPVKTVKELELEAFAAISGGTETTVEIEEEKN